MEIGAECSVELVCRIKPLLERVRSSRFLLMMTLSLEPIVDTRLTSLACIKGHTCTSTSMA